MTDRTAARLFLVLLTLAIVTMLAGAWTLRGGFILAAVLLALAGALVAVPRLLREVSEP